MTSSDSESSLLNRFLESLQELPFVRAELEKSPANTTGKRDRVDAWIKLEVAGKWFSLPVHVRKAFYPRDVRQVLWEIQESYANSYSNSPTMLITEFLSPGAKELLREAKVGYFDSGGSLFLPAPGAYIFVDKPPPKPLERAVRSLFSGRSAQVLHALLIHRQEWLGVTEVAEKALVAPSTASSVMSELERFDWVESRGLGPAKQRYLREPGALLDAWAKHTVAQRAPEIRRYFVPGNKSENLAQQMAHLFELNQVDYALSYEAAAQRYSPFLSNISQIRFRVLISQGVADSIAALDARVVSEGSNIGIVESRSSGDFLFRQQIDGIWTASPIQVYLDLLRSEGRAKEMADHLRSERIGF
jgi:hypothetical protein